MSLHRRILLFSFLIGTIISTGVYAQDTPPPEPPTPMVIPTDIPPTPVPPPTDIPPTDVPTETFTPEPSLTPLPPPTDTPVPTVTDTASPEASLTPSETSTDEASPTLTVSPSLTATASATVSLTPSMTASAQTQNQMGVIQPLANPIACTPSATLSIASVSSTGDLGNDSSGRYGLAISDTGRYVVFTSTATNLVPNDTNGKEDLFVFDRQTCQTSRVSTALDGTQANNETDDFAISEDGQVITFLSGATNLIPGDPNGGIFVRNLTANTLTRIPSSVLLSSFMPSISGDGHYITFTNQAGSNNNIILYDTQTDQSTTIQTVALITAHSKISRDGSTVVFVNANASLSFYDRVTQQITAQTFPMVIGSLFDISANGRYVVFGSTASNLVANDTNNADDIFLFDRQTSQITRVSVGNAGLQANGESAYPAISPDGRYVSFVTGATNLIPNTSDTNGNSDVIIRDLTQQVTYSVSFNSSGVLANYGSGAALSPISGDNNYVVFLSYSSNLVSGDTNSNYDVYVAKRSGFAPATPTPTPIPTTTPGIIQGNFPCNPSAAMSIASVDSAGTQGTSGSYYPNMSATGRYIAFHTASVNLVYGDTNGQGDVFVFDRLTCQTVRASVAANGTQGNAGSAYPSVSSNGRYVTFLSSASNLAAGDSDNLWDVFIKDLQTGAVTRLQTGFAGTNGDYGAAFVAGDDHTVIFRTSNTISLYDILTQQQTILVTATNLQLVRNAISSNLRYLVFSSSTNNLVLNDTNNLSDVFLFDRQTSQTIRLSVSPTGTGGNSNSDYASISADGRYAVFNSYASNLAGTNAVFSIEVFVRDLQNLVTYQVSVSSDGTEGNGSSGYGSISDDGRYVAFLSESTNLVSGDDNSQDDVFVRDRQTNQTYLISRIPASALGNGQSDRPMMSRDGKYIAFASGASNLLNGDTNRSWDVFVAQAAAFAPATPTPTPSLTPSTLTLTAYYMATYTAMMATYGPQMTATSEAGATYSAATETALAANCTAAGMSPLQLGSVNILAGFGNNDSGTNSIAISDSGRYVAFISAASDLVWPDVNDAIDDVFLFDRQICQSILISKSPSGNQANHQSSSVAISADGQIIAFASAATNLVVGDTNSGIFVRNLTANTLIRIPNTTSASSSPSISGDGRYVTYTDLVNASTRNIMLYDIQMAQSKLIESVASSATYSKISRDGSTVFYFNSASSLGLYSLSTQQTYPLLANVNPAAMFDVSDTGRYVVFGSDATNLVPGDTNNALDIFVLDQQTSQITRASVSTAGVQATTQSAFPAISPDGRFVSFVSSAANLVANDTNGFSDVFVRDLMQQLTYMVSVGPNGVSGNNGSGSAIAPFSGDDKYLVFVSNASNLVSGDTNAKADVFIADNLAYHPGYVATATAGAATATAAALTPSPTIDPFTTVTPGGPIPCLPSSPVSLVSVSSSGSLANNPGVLPVPSAGNYSISNTGRYIVYLSASTNLVPIDTNGKTDLFIFDRENCLTTKLSNALDGTQANNDSTWSAISADGQTVVFGSLATNLISNDANGGIFVRDFHNNTLIRISDVTNVYYTPSISGDGRYITFPEKVNASTSNIVLFDRQTNQKQTIDTVSATGVASKISPDGSTIIYSYNYSVMAAYDRSTQQKTLKTVTGLPNPIYGVSGNGRYVVFSSNANNLTANDSNSDFDVFLWDRQNDLTSLISVSSNGIQGNGASAYPDISSDGRYVTFFSSATNLVANDSNNSTDVFVRDIIQQVTYVVSASPSGAIGNQSSGIYGSPISGDNRFVVFFSSATNLVAGVTGQMAQVYIAQRAAFAPADISATQTAGAPATATANAIATATYTAANGLIVNTTSNTDDGTCNISHCSLVEAVNASNAMVGVQIIKFNIPGTGVHTITLSSSLILTSSAIIDGTTQPGYSGAPLIELVPQSSNTPYTAIVINGATPTTYDPNTSVTIRGLIINSFSGFGIHVSNGQHHLIEGNYIGTDATGSLAEGNDTGIIMTSPNNTIRDNVISGNLNAGIYMNSNGGRNSTNNLIVGNYIGTDASGINELPNQRGIRITEGASNNTIGGTAAGTANLISGNLVEGILIDGNTTNGNVITGNIIGLDANSQYLLGNGTAGIGVSAALNTVIGGATAAEGNDIWGNAYGINLYNAANNTVIRSNVIAQNGTQGIVLSTNNNTISDNIIAFHTGQGIVVSGGTGNRISQNRIYSNGGLGIDLGVNGVSPNDVGDADSGANNLQNFPVITSAVDSGLTSTVNGTFNSQPNQTYHLEFFSNAVCSASGYGQGQNSLGATDVTTDANGNANFAAQVGSLAVGNNFGTNWSGTFYPSNNLTGTGVAVNNIQGLSFLWGTGAPVVNGVPVTGMPSDNFSAQFTSMQTFAAGTYTFIVSADDGVRVYIDGVLKLDKFVGRVLTTDSFTTALTAGSHSLTVEYFEGINQAALQVQWHLNGVSNGFITSTATDSNGNTSEFSACSPMQSVLSLGSYQENNENLVYSGSWVDFSGSGPKGGTFKYTNDANGKVRFMVDSSVGRISIYRTTYSIYGSTQVFVDGVLAATINSNSPNLVFGVQQTVAITPGNHTIVLQNVGSTYSSLDQIDLLPPANTLGIGTYQETDANLTYSGLWAANSTALALGGSRIYTNDTNGSVSFGINNTVGKVTIYHTTYLAGVYGPIQVYLDGAAAPVATLNTSSASFTFGVPFSFFVTPGNHTITLKNVGSTYSDLDQIVLEASTPLSTGTYQETDAALIYNGTWASNSNPSALGGSRKYTNDPNGSVSFVIDSSVSRITLYRTQYMAGVYGSIQVFLDGASTPLATVNNTSASFVYGVPFTFTVTPGDHIITLKNVGSTYSDIDQITLQGAAAPLGIGTYQETDANLTYSGLWASNSTALALGGSRIYTNDPNGSVSFSINNTVGKVTIYRTTYLAGVYGPMQVYLDGAAAPFATLNTTSASFTFGVPFSFFVAPGNHTITLKNAGSTYSDLDQIVLEASTPLSTGTYQETDAALIYNGTWASNSNPSALGGSRKYTNDPNGSVSFAIDSSVSRITLYRTTYLAGVYGSTQVFVDNNPVPLMTISNTSSAFIYGQPSTFTVTPGDHIITLKNVGSTYSDIDQITLQGAAVPLGIGTYQETDANLTYSGLWAANSTALALGGSRIYTNDPNGSVSFSINNTVGKVTIYHTTYLAGVYGPMQVYLDGAAAPFATLNTSSASFTFGVPFSFFVAPGNHTITLKNVGSTYSDLDQIVLEASTPLSTGTYQETDAALIYNGTWSSNSNPSALGGSRKYTNDPNGSVSFVIDSSVGRVTLYRTTYLAGVYGSTQVFVDNNPVPLMTISNTSSAFIYGQPSTFSVTPGNHVITLRNVGSTYSDIDQITLLSAAAPLGIGTYQETDANLTYSGNWTPNTNVLALVGSRIYTNDPNGSVSFSIDNTVGKVTIYRTTYLAGVYGPMQVYLDGAAAPLATLNTTSASFVYGVPFTFVVTPGNHVITLKNVSTTYSDIDQITLQAAAPLSVGDYQETNANLVFNGVWTPNTTPAALGGARSYTNDPNGSVSFSIDTTVSKVTVYRTTYSMYGSMQVYLDNSPTPFATINNTSSAFLFQQPFTFTVTPGNHVITLKNVGTTYGDLDQITLQP